MFLFGYHACLAALKNPKRVIEKLLVSDEKILETLPKHRHTVETLTKAQLERLLPPGAVHQGIVLKAQPLPSHFLEDFVGKSDGFIVLLDQVVDPHNVGAIFRSAAAFGVTALVMTDRHAPKESGVMAKAASGALEIIPYCLVKNLSQILLELREHGFWSITLMEKATQTLDQIDVRGKVALVLGSEGQGVRRLTAERCDFHARLKTAETFTTLNVSNAAAIGLYEIFKNR